MKALKVAELNSYIKKYISMDFLLSDICVTGELSNLTIHRNGNAYFSIKDSKASISALAGLSAFEDKCELKDGDLVIAKGSLSYYTKSGRLSLYVDEIEISGEGEFYRNYFLLKEKLAKEGLFDQKYKKVIDKNAKRIGVVTSESGAAVVDIVNILRERNDLVDIFIYHANVQGTDAASSIAEGIKFFDNFGVDTIIIGRGGGSYEDLDAFNDEDLARTIFRAKTPIISAVGHEIDMVISDLVADLRASTPTDAAKKAVVSKDSLKDELLELKSSLDIEIKKTLSEKSLDLNILRSYLRPDGLTKEINANNTNLKRFFGALNFSIDQRMDFRDVSLKSKLAILDNYLENNLKLGERIENFEKLGHILEQKISSYSTYADNLLRELDDVFYGYAVAKNIKLLNTFDDLDVSELSNRIEIERYKLQKHLRDLNESPFFIDLNLDFSFLEKSKSTLISFEKKLIESSNELEILKLKLKNSFMKISKVNVKNIEGEKLTSVKNLVEGQILRILFKDGIADVVVIDIRKGEHGA